MVNFIIYEDEVKFRDLYFSVIDNYFKNTKIAYEITEINKYDRKTEKTLEKIGDNRIYILDIEVPGMSGLDLARKIRNDNDYQSQIIIVTTHDNLKDYDMLSDMLTLAFISKFYDLENILREKLKKAYEIVTSNKLIEFQRKNQIYQVLLNDILYIEKSIDENVATIITKNDRYKTNLTLAEVEERLENDPRFYRVNRGCIINLNKVTMYDKDDDILEFGPTEYVDVISKSKKKELRKLLDRNQQKEFQKAGVK